MKVLVSDPIHPDGLAWLRKHGVDVVQELTGDQEALRAALREVDGWLVRSRTRVTHDLLDQAPHLKVIVRVGVGLDNIDVEAASKRGILVSNTPQATAESVAEHTLALMFALVRQVVDAVLSMRKGQWEKKHFMGRELSSMRLGIIGLGRIGSAVARKARALGMEVWAYSRSMPQDRAQSLGVELATPDTIFRHVDILTLHVPLTPQTHHMIRAESFSRMKRGMFLVNCSRGGVVDEASLLEALETGIVAGAALDVFETEPPPPDHPLLHHPRVLATPHIAAQTEEAQRRASLEAAQKILTTLRGEDALG